MAAILCGLLAALFMEAGTARALPASANSAVNLWVLAMEITQAAQPWLAVNSQSTSPNPIEIEYSPEAIPLVRGKRTVVRVYPGLEGSRLVMTGVEALLTCHLSPKTPCPGPAKIEPVASILVDQAYGNDLDALRSDASRTWNFVLPDDWTTQLVPIRLTATITAPHDQSEGYLYDDEANSLALSNLTFNVTAPLRLKIVYGCVRRKASDPPSACDTAPIDTHTALFTSGDSLIVQTFPLAAHDFQLALRSPITVPVDGDLQSSDGAMTPDRMTAFLRLVCSLAQLPSGGQRRSTRSLSGWCRGQRWASSASAANAASWSPW